MADVAISFKYSNWFSCYAIKQINNKIIRANPANPANQANRAKNILQHLHLEVDIAVYSRTALKTISLPYHIQPWEHTCFVICWFIFRIFDRRWPRCLGRRKWLIGCMRDDDKGKYKSWESPAYSTPPLLATHALTHPSHRTDRSKTLENTDTPTSPPSIKVHTAGKLAAWSILNPVMHLLANHWCSFVL